MRRLVASVAVLALGLAGGFLYRGLDAEREFWRLIDAGDVAVTRDQSLDALEAYSGALALHSDSVAGYLKRGDTYRRLGNLDAAARDLGRAARLSPTDPRPRERLGDVALEREAYDAAGVHYRAAIRLDDQDPEVLYKLALARHRAGRFGPAVPLLRRALALDPELVEAHYLLGLALRVQGRQAAARTALERAIELSPWRLEARAALAEILAERPADRRAYLRQLDALAALDETRPDWRIARALAFAEEGDVPLAVRSLHRTREDHPDAVTVRTALARIWMAEAERGDAHAAGRARDALRGLAPAGLDSGALVLLARTHLLAGDTDEGHRLLRLAVDRRPVDPEALRQLARLDEAAGDAEAAARGRAAYRVLVGPTTDDL